MNVVADMVWLTPLFPFVGAVVLGFVGRRGVASKTVVYSVAMLGPGAACCVAWTALVQGWAGAASPGPRVVEVWQWVSGGELAVVDGAPARLEISAALLLDPVSLAFAGLVSLVGLLVLWAAIEGFSADGSGTGARFLGAMNLLQAALLVVVLAANLPTLYLGWEGVGFCSMLLIGRFGGEEAPSTVTGRAFVIGRIGAACFLLAMVLSLYFFGTLELEALRAAVVADSGSDLSTSATMISILLFAAAAGVSAQFPLQVWLKGVAIAPAPASALIQSAAMVVAGGFVMVRTGFLVLAAPVAMLTIGIVGGVTAVVAAAVSLVQDDIRKVLSRLTVSMLGLAFLAIGAGAVRAAALHLMVQIVAMACLVLGSGLVIRTLDGETKMARMGGLGRTSPGLFWPFLVAAVVIAAVPPSAAFVSKDAALSRVFEAGMVDLFASGRIFFALWGLGLIGAAAVALSVFRLVFYVFFGDYRGTKKERRPRPVLPLAAMLPPVLLAAAAVGLSLVIGMSGRFSGNGPWSIIDDLPRPSVGGIGPGAELALSALTAMMVLMGIAMAARLFLLDRGFVRAEGLARRFPVIRSAVRAEFWIETLYDIVVVRGVVWCAGALKRFDRQWLDGAVGSVRHTTVGLSWLSGIFDHRVLSGLVDRTGSALGASSFALRRLQTGATQVYLMVMVFGAAVLLGLVFVVIL